MGLGCSSSLLSRGPEGLCIPSGHQGQGDTMCPGRGCTGGTLREVPVPWRRKLGHSVSPPQVICACSSGASGAGPGPQAASGALPGVAGIALEDATGEAEGEQDAGGQSGPWPRVARSRSSSLAEGEGWWLRGGCFGKKRIFHPKPAGA